MPNDSYPASDPFDPIALRIDPALGPDLGVAKKLFHVGVRKPSRQEFFRTRHEPEFRMLGAIIELKDDREVYLVTPDAAAALPGEVRVVEIRVCVTRGGTVFLWPVAQPTADGREIAWHITARKAAELAESRWTRMAANIGAGCYDVFEAPAGLSEPVWPKAGLSDLLRVAFGNGKLIDSVDHSVLRRLRGL